MQRPDFSKSKNAVRHRHQHAAMRFRLRTLLILLVMVPLLAWITWLSGALVSLIVYVACAAAVKWLWLSGEGFCADEGVPRTRLMPCSSVGTLLIVLALVAYYAIGAYGASYYAKPADEATADYVWNLAAKAFRNYTIPDGLR